MIPCFDEKSLKSLYDIHWYHKEILTGIVINRRFMNSINPSDTFFT